MVDILAWDSCLSEVTKGPRTGVGTREEIKKTRVALQSSREEAGEVKLQRLVICNGETGGGVLFGGKREVMMMGEMGFELSFCLQRESDGERGARAVGQ